MSADLICFVDSIATSPTVRLNLNDNAPWRCPEFSAPPPRLRRSTAVNAMRDGGLPGTSNYDMRTVTMVLDLAGTQDAQASQIQLLARELDRADNFLKYQPNGLTKPVFFKVFRSNVTELEDKEAQSPKRRLKVELLCEPFALGLREDIASANVSNAATGTDLVLTLAGIIGDVSTPCVVWTSDTLSIATFAISCSPHAPVLLEAEVDTTTSATISNVTADATYSGSAGKRWTPAGSGSTYTVFVTLTIPAGLPASQYKVYARVKKSVAGDSWIGQVQTDTGTADDFTLASSTGFQMVDMGYIAVPPRSPGRAGELPWSAQQLTFQVGRPSGSGTLDLDFLALIPADGSTAHMTAPSYSSKAACFDSVNDAEYLTTSGGPFAGGAELARDSGFNRAGALPMLIPSTNYLCFLRLDDAVPVSNTVGLRVSYWPQYLSVRPSAS